MTPKPSEIKEETGDVKNEQSESKDEEMEDREQKIRKTDDDSKKNTPFPKMIQSEIEKKKKELAALEQESMEAKTIETMQNFPTTSGHVLGYSGSTNMEEKMDVEPEPSNESTEIAEEDEDYGEIHIVSPILILFHDQKLAKSNNSSISRLTVG